MDDDQFKDIALVVLGHGSSTNARSGQPVFDQAKRLRETKKFAEVHEAFWKQNPQIKKVLAEISARHIAIVPLFVSEGYFSENVIPTELGFGAGPERILQNGNQISYYCKPIGTHPQIAEGLLERAVAVIESFPFPRKPEHKAITLIIAGHGTQRDPGSRKAVEAQADRIREREIYADVHAVFLEETPCVSDSYKLAQTRNIVVVPMLIGEGDHTQKDIPILLGEPERIVNKRLAENQPPWRNPTERHGKLVWYATSIGLEPRLAEIILDRVREAIQRKPRNA